MKFINFSTKIIQQEVLKIRSIEIIRYLLRGNYNQIIYTIIIEQYNT